MPLVRVQVRNEYGLGQPELYREANIEDPKAVLDGVAVAGLVGILRQLGDLAEFAAEVFHGLQEQVINTSSRSQKLTVRLQRIEAAFPSIEKAILAQKSHLHFAYMAGSVWHAHLQTEQSQFLYRDLPQFIINSYEECLDPPRLHLLDKFDSGGPGSCLKRYSDPTFFSRASDSLGEVHVEKVPKNRKARRSKKNRAWMRNEVSHGASISNHGNRMNFASLKIDGQVSPSQTLSSSDTTVKPDLVDQSNSFDSRIGSGYIECVFEPTYSLKAEENEPKESSFSSLRLDHINNIHSATANEHSGFVYNDSPHSLSQEQIGPSSCVTWDEKTEIVEPIGHLCDHDESAEVLTMNFDRDDQETGAVKVGSVDQIDFHFDNGATPASVSGQNQIDDIESEPDNYLDALNTIESESEIDMGYQTKREMEQSSISNDKETEDGMHGLTAEHPSNIEMPIDKPHSISSLCYANEKSPQMRGESSDISNSLHVDFCGNDVILNASNGESVVSNSLYSGFREPNPKASMSDKMISTSCEFQKSPAEHSGVQSVKFWTNGGLLGLEPSKPPDISVLNTVIQDSLTINKDEMASSSSQSKILNGDGDAGKPDKLVQSSKILIQSSLKSSTSCHNDEDDISGKKTSWRDGENESSQRDGGNESQISGLSNGFFVNDFQRKISLVHGEKSEHHASRKTGIFEQPCRNQSITNQALSERNLNGYFGSPSPIHSSPSSSPPLQHMKISFQPINGFETSELKLKFPDGNYSHHCSTDMLPSFQLVPEPATPRHDTGSDSDDDTFCRSSPYKSDDCLSHHSDSNSEQWESDGTLPIKNNDLYDALRQISSTECVSTPVELDRIGDGGYCADFGFQGPYVETCLQPCQSGCLPDLPSLNTMNPLFELDMKNSSDAKDIPELKLNTSMPLPPPLPPLQWRLMNSHSDVTFCEQDSVSEVLDHAFEMKILVSPISPQSKSSPAKQQQTTDEAIVFTPKSKQPELQKSYGQREVKHAGNGRGTDEKEDFLHQIRTKSFNLRRIATEKPTVTPMPAANVKVTAILKKANAIRQAVGSDDGEDDNWSDT
ncbi:phosphoenolpyruvate carboxylase [Sarracenia purpurea var. burkii]